MPTVQELKEGFRAQAAADENDESERKMSFIRQAEKLDEPGVAEFLTGILEDPQESADIRCEVIAALRVLESRQATDRQVVADALSRVAANDDDDEIIGSLAAAALERYVDVPGVLSAAWNILNDRTEDENVRHGAFSAVEAAGLNPQSSDLMVKLLSDPLFARHAQRVLVAWGIRR